MQPNFLFLNYIPEYQIYCKFTPCESPDKIVGKPVFTGFPSVYYGCQSFLRVIQKGDFGVFWRILRTFIYHNITHIVYMGNTRFNTFINNL